MEFVQPAIKLQIYGGYITFSHDWFRDVGVHLTDLKFPAMNSILESRRDLRTGSIMACGTYSRVESG